MIRVLPRSSRFRVLAGIAATIVVALLVAVAVNWARAEPLVCAPEADLDSGCVPSATVFARAETWLTTWNGGPVPYRSSTDPRTWHQGYRRDCSGYVSLALGLVGPGPDTTALAARSVPIDRGDLRPGDLMINPAPGADGHVVLFERWTGPDHTRYWGYEQSGGVGTRHHVLPYPRPGDYPMSPYRFLAR